MRFNSGFERPQLRRRMATKKQKFSMYRASDQDMVFVESEKKENIKETEENYRHQKETVL